jgi:hypothetical protein
VKNLISTNGKFYTLHDELPSNTNDVNRTEIHGHVPQDGVAARASDGKEALQGGEYRPVS